MAVKVIPVSASTERDSISFKSILESQGVASLHDIISTNIRILDRYSMIGIVPTWMVLSERMGGHYPLGGWVISIGYPWYGGGAAKAVLGSTTKYRVSTAILSSILMSPSPSPPISTTPTAKAKRPKPSRNGSLANVVCFLRAFLTSTQLSPFPILSKKMTIWRQNQFLSDWPQKSPLNKAWPYFLHFLTTFRQTHNFQVSHQIVLVF